MSFFSIQSASASISSLVPLLQTISGPITSSSTLPSTYSVVAPLTEVTLGDINVSVDASNRVVVRSTNAFYADAVSQTFAGASAVTTYFSDLDMLAGAVASTNAGAVLGQGSRVVVSDQTYATGTWQILAQYVGVNEWAISITRLTTSPKNVVLTMISFNLNNLNYSVNGGSSWSTISLPTAVGLYLVSVANSKYITYETSDARLFSSQNGGSSFTQIAGSWDAANLATSQSGQYQYLVNSFSVPRQVWRSTNYGVTFTAGQTVSGAVNTYVYVACSRTGQYVLVFDQSVANQNIFRVSNDFGATFSAVTVANVGGQNRGVAVSANGQVMYGINRLGQLFKSTNAGVSFTLVSTIPAQYISPNVSHNMGSLSCSADGSLLIALDCSGYIWRSADAGLTWSNSATINGQPQSAVVTGTNCFFNGSMSADGKYVMAGGYYDNVTPSICVSSSDFGLTYTTLPAPLNNLGGYNTAVSP